MKNEDTLGVVARYFQYLNSEEWDKMAQLWHEDAQLDASGARPRVGPQQAIEYFRKAFRPYVTHDDAPTSITVNGGDASVDIHYVGVTHDGQQVVIDAHSDYEVRDGRIARLTTRYDVNRARSDLTPSSDPDS